MHPYRSTGNLAIRPCEICNVLVLHEEGVLTAAGRLEEPNRQLDRWRAFPHNAPGGASCIGGGAAARAMRRSVHPTDPIQLMPLDHEPA